MSFNPANPVIGRSGRQAQVVATGATLVGGRSIIGAVDNGFGEYITYSYFDTGLINASGTDDHDLLNQLAVVNLNVYLTVYITRSNGAMNYHIASNPTAAATFAAGVNRTTYQMALSSYPLTVFGVPEES